jgi:hypothetical protein
MLVAEMPQEFTKILEFLTTGKNPEASMIFFGA